MTLIASCKANLVGRWGWLKEVLSQLPLATSPESLLPPTWLQTHPNTTGPSPNAENSNVSFAQMNRLRFTPRLRTNISMRNSKNNQSLEESTATRE
jgi:hypothetical protein